MFKMGPHSKVSIYLEIDKIERFNKSKCGQVFNVAKIIGSICNIKCYHTDVVECLRTEWSSTHRFPMNKYEWPFAVPSKRPSKPYSGQFSNFQFQLISAFSNTE